MCQPKGVLLSRVELTFVHTMEQRSNHFCIAPEPRRETSSGHMKQHLVFRNYFALVYDPPLGLRSDKADGPGNDDDACFVPDDTKCFETETTETTAPTV